MRLINVEIVCPSTSRSYDYKIPPLMKAGTVKQRIIEDIRIYEGIDDLLPNVNKIGLYCEDMSVIGNNVNFETAGVKNGDKIMLI